MVVAITGIEDPLCVGVHEAVATCHHAGVTVDTTLSFMLLTHKSTSRLSLSFRSWRGLPLKIRKFFLKPLALLARLLVSDPETKRLSFGGPNAYLLDIFG